MSKDASDDGDKKRTRHIDLPLGDRLRSLREQAGLTRKDLAEALGISVSLMQHMEDGVSRIPASRLWQLCHILDVEVSEWFEGMPWSVRLTDKDETIKAKPARPGVEEDGAAFGAPPAINVRPPLELRSLTRFARELNPRDLKIALAAIRAIKTTSDDISS